MNVFESFIVALDAIWANKMRSLLTMLGIIIGISSVIIVVALGDSSQNMITREFEKFGVNRFYYYNNWDNNPTQKDYFTYDDVMYLKNALPDDIDAISPSLYETGKISHRNKKYNFELAGVNEQYSKIEKVEILHGRYLLESDIKGRRNVSVIDEKAAKEIYNRTDVVGEKISVDISGYKFTTTIVGVYRPMKISFGNFGGYDTTYKLYVPASTLGRVTWWGTEVYPSLEINSTGRISADDLKPKIEGLLERKHNNVGEDMYRGYSAESELSMFNKVTDIIVMVVSAIAAISLLVGGIGIMNIMLVSVTERTREIGVRKAIGAKYKDIMAQFIIESTIISGIGGVLGTILGILVSTIVALALKLPPSVSLKTIIIAFVFSAGVGLFFGIYPANKAAKLDPIESLRYE